MFTVNFFRTVRTLSGRSSADSAKFSSMNSKNTDIWGQDIALDPTGQAQVAANGELTLTEDVQTGVQDIALRLFTRLGTLFYDTEFGSLIHDWIHEESTPENRAAFEAEVTMRVEADPRVVLGTVSCRVLRWDENVLAAEVLWRFIDVDQPLNLVMQINKATLALVIDDAKPQDLAPFIS